MAASTDPPRLDSRPTTASPASGPGYAQHPQHEVRIDPAEQRVRVSVGGTVIAETHRALRLRESRYPDTYYLPPEDVRAQLAPSPTSTYCPFKGTASYWSLPAAKAPSEQAPQSEIGIEIADVAWSYEEPYREVAALRGRVSFYADKVTVELLAETP